MTARDGRFDFKANATTSARERRTTLGGQPRKPRPDGALRGRVRASSCPAARTVPDLGRAWHPQRSPDVAGGTLVPERELCQLCRHPARSSADHRDDDDRVTAPVCPCSPQSSPDVTNVTPATGTLRSVVDPGPAVDRGHGSAPGPPRSTDPPRKCGERGGCGAAPRPGLMALCPTRAGPGCHTPQPGGPASLGAGAPGAAALRLAGVTGTGPGRRWAARNPARPNAVVTLA